MPRSGMQARDAHSRAAHTSIADARNLAWGVAYGGERRREPIPAPLCRRRPKMP